MKKASIKQTLDLALQHHTAGRLAEAEEIYQVRRVKFRAVT